MSLPYVSKPPFWVIFPSDPTVLQRTYCVIGVPRGGTSMVSGLLSRLGVSMGAGVSEDYEDREFLGHEGIRALFSDPERADAKAGYLSQVSALIARRNRNHDIWGWKDPISIYYLPEVYGHLRNPHFIFVTRDLGAVGQREMQEEPGLSPSHVLAHIHAAARGYTMCAEFLAAVQAPALLLSYERSILNTDDAVDGLLDFVGYSPPGFREWSRKFVRPEAV